MGATKPGELDLKGRDSHLMRECFENDAEHGQLIGMVSDEIAATDVNAQLWFEASARADRSEGRLAKTDPFALQSITGGRTDPEFWPGSAARFMSRQAAQYNVSTTTVRGSFNLARLGDKESLFNLACYVRKMLFAKRFQLAAIEIQTERERRLREKLGLGPNTPLSSRARTSNPYYNYLPLELMTAYMQGSREEAIFAIEDVSLTQVGNTQVKYANWAKGVKPIEE